MQTITEPKSVNAISFESTYSRLQVSANDVKRLKIKECISWAVCFSVITFLTGLIKILNVGMTMDTVTSAIFYLSLTSLIYSVYRIVSLTRSPDSRVKKSDFQKLN